MTDRNIDIEAQIDQSPMTRRARWANQLIAGITPLRQIMPKWWSKYSIMAYLLALAVVTYMYSAYSLPWYYMLSGIVAVSVFFWYGRQIAKRTSVLKLHREKSFERILFWNAFVIRVIWMGMIYYIFMEAYGNPFGFENLDATFYDDMGSDVAEWLSSGTFSKEWNQWSIDRKGDLSDMGYATYVGFIYWLTDNSIIAVRLLKCVWSSLTVLLIYRLAKRNFDEQTARIAGIFVALWPNFWYYCGVHLKETEMVFMAVLFVEQADKMLRSRQFTSWKVVPVLLIAAAMFTFRTPLGLVALLALIFSVVMSSARVVNWGKRIIIGVLAVLLVGVTVGNRIEERAKGLIEQVQMGQQKSNMEWRSKRKFDGKQQSFAKYASATVFAPMIFTLPFPSMVRPFDGQDVQQLLNGGNFVKNIMSFFTIFALITLLLSGKWRDHLLPLSFMLGYLVVLTVSVFAHSERFHQPAMPFEMMFAAYGLGMVVPKKKYKRWFMYWCVMMFIAAIAWNWFKLKGRGL